MFYVLWSQLYNWMDSSFNEGVFVIHFPQMRDTLDVTMIPATTASCRTVHVHQVLVHTVILQSMDVLNFADLWMVLKNMPLLEWGNGNECYCGISGTNFSRRGVRSDSDCLYSCSGSAYESCGGTGTVSLYLLVNRIATHLLQFLDFFHTVIQHFVLVFNINALSLPLY